MPDPLPDPSAVQLGNYIVAYHQSRLVLSLKQHDLAVQAQTTGDADTADAADSLSESISTLDNDATAFITKYRAPGVPPPSQDVIDAAQRLSVSVGQQIAQNRDVTAILAGVASFLNDWGQLVNGTIPAPTAPPPAGGQ